MRLGRIALFILLGLVAVAWLSLPEPQFSQDFSKAIYSADGELLSARVSTDEQWRFRIEGTLSDKYVQALLHFEDRRFFYHPGIDPFGILRALRDNLKVGKVVSGGSTLTMQLARLGLGNVERSYWNKAVEALVALKLESRYSKEEILRLYAQHAPFGGNLVGVQSASVRYLRRHGDALTWADAALLAILPNRPGTLHLGTQRAMLQQRRDTFLDRLARAEIISEETARISKREALPNRLHAIPQFGGHLLDLGVGESGGITTLDARIQAETKRLLKRHMNKLAANHIENSALIVARVDTGDVLAYHGNVVVSGREEESAAYVDCAQAKRSTGSTLKPILFAQAMAEGQFFPRELLTDLPVRLGGFRPENYDRSFRGVVHADEALASSLNVPAVRVLEQFGVERFHEALLGLGMGLNEDPWFYGLSMILGGAESSLWQLTAIYRTLARVLRDGETRSIASNQVGLRLSQDMPDRYDAAPTGRKVTLESPALWLMTEALEKVERPATHDFVDIEELPRRFAWKTGTSFGFRDGWAIGFDRDYVVGVWVGNANGLGRQNLTGRRAAAPILFDVLQVLPEAPWFETPLGLKFVEVCSKSGQLAGEFCESTEQINTQAERSARGKCDFCKHVMVCNQTNKRVHLGCEDPSRASRSSQFILGPEESFWYTRHRPSYREPPVWRSDCAPSSEDTGVKVVSPLNNAVILLAKSADAGVVLEAAVSRPDAQLYWYLNERYLGDTTQYHQRTERLSPGDYLLTVTDSEGGRSSRRFTVE